jgi:hypothetical protein
MGLKELQEIKENRGKPKEKKKYVIPKISEKRKKQILENGIYIKNKPLDDWFLARKREMVGYCTACSAASPKFNTQRWKWGICHLLPKSLFPSVETHEENWIELCEDHHNMLDTNMEKFSQLPCWQELVNKVKGFSKEVKEHHKILDYYLK